MTDVASKMLTEDSDAEFFSEADMNAEEELYAVVSKMKDHLTELSNIIINVYANLIFPSINRRQILACKGCINDCGDRSEHDCLEKPSKDFLEKCITEVGIYRLKRPLFLVRIFHM